MERIKVSRKDVEQIINATFPDYKGRKIQIEAKEKTSLYGLNWEGGSRNRFRGCTLGGVFTGSADKYNNLAPWDPNQVYGESAVVSIPPGMVLVQHIIFQGEDLGLRIYCNPADMPKYIAMNVENDLKKGIARLGPISDVIDNFKR